MFSRCPGCRTLRVIEWSGRHRVYNHPINPDRRSFSTAAAKSEDETMLPRRFHSRGAREHLWLTAKGDRPTSSTEFPTPTPL